MNNGNDGHHHHHPRLDQVWSTRSIFEEATVIFHSHLFTFFFLSHLIYCFHTMVEIGTHDFTSFIDNDPALIDIFSRLHLFGIGNNIIDGNKRHRLQAPDDSSAAARRRHLSRVWTLDGGSFSVDNDEDRSLYESNRKAALNGTEVFFGDFLKSKSGFSDSIVENGIRVSEVVHSGITFKPQDMLFTDMTDSDVNGDDQGKENEVVGSEDVKEGDRVAYLQVLMNELNLGLRDLEDLFFFFSSLSASYGCVFLVFLVTYSCVLGNVFVTVANDLNGMNVSFLAEIANGSELGMKRLYSFIMLKWLVTAAFTCLLGWQYFQIWNLHSLFKLAVRLMMMPFSNISPWIQGSEEELSSFMFSWAVMDTSVALLFSVDAWISIADTTKSRLEIARDGWDLISIMMADAIKIKCFEAILCGPHLRVVLGQLFGSSAFGSMFQSTMEVYFMVVWLMYYFAAKRREADFRGRSFGEAELNLMVEGHLHDA